QVSGNDYRNTGDGVNNLCLPNNPENGQHQSYTNDQVYGGEYRLTSSVKPSGWSESLNQKEIPCSVCYQQRRSAVLMIPGRKTCYKGWNSEYHGYLMSDHKTHHRRDYACVDINAEPLDNLNGGASGALFYPLRTNCGSLRCPPYTDSNLRNISFQFSHDKDGKNQDVFVVCDICLSNCIAGFFGYSYFILFISLGVTYVRWGKKNCPKGADTVYTGQAGGNYQAHKGGGVNYLCLPNDPENGQHQSYDNAQGYGGEYEVSSTSKPSGWSGSMGSKEVPCSVCYRKQRSAVLMIPGRKTCYKGWNSEYNGYLMSDHNVYSKKDYACEDKNAEQLDNKNGDENGALFYTLRTKCGSLRCPPYTNEADVLCFVCTKSNV
ncbi:Hypothetical predicted protein, partial [Mytilus galloprovincialis]